VGYDRRIPVEVKFAKKDIGKPWRDGHGQVEEFLRRKSKMDAQRGILVIADQERDPDRQKFTKMEDNIYTIVI